MKKIVFFFTCILLGFCLSSLSGHASSSSYIDEFKKSKSFTKIKDHSIKESEETGFSKKIEKK